MSSIATTLGASRTFAGNVVVTWTPSTTSSKLTVVITVGGAFAWQFIFDSDNTSSPVDGSGDTWSLDGGTFTAEYSGDAKSGLLKAHSWKYTVEKNEHHFDGPIGAW
jgi:hypothetical protein